MGHEHGAKSIAHCQINAYERIAVELRHPVYDATRVVSPECTHEICIAIDADNWGKYCVGMLKKTPRFDDALCVATNIQATPLRTCFDPRNRCYRHACDIPWRNRDEGGKHAHVAPV